MLFRSYLGTVEQVDAGGVGRIEQRNKFFAGEEIEVMKPDGRDVSVIVENISDEEGNPMKSAPHPKQKLYVTVREIPGKTVCPVFREEGLPEEPAFRLRDHDILRRAEQEEPA